MKHLNIVAALIAVLAIVSASPADAQMEKSKPGKAMQERSQDGADRAEVQRDKKSREQIEDAMEDETADVEDSDDDYMGDVDANDVVRDKSVKAKNKSAKKKWPGQRSHARQRKVPGNAGASRRAKSDQGRVQGRWEEQHGRTRCR